MEQQQTTKEESTSKRKQLSTIPIRVTKATAKTIKGLIQKLNKKSFGRKVKPDDLIQKSISLLTDEHLEQIKQATMTNSDRLEVAYQEYCQAHGEVSKDEFFGLLLREKSP